MFLPSLSQYFKRGFDAYLVDPYCNHLLQCKHDLALSFPYFSPSDNVLRQNENCQLSFAGRSERDGLIIPWSIAETPWKAAHVQRSRHRQWDTIVQQVESEEEENCIQACCKVRSDSWGWRCIALFELEDRHALDFFSKRHGWSKEERDMVARHPPTQCYACDHCRYEYAMYVVFSKDPLASLIDPDDLREAVSFAKGRTVKCGGTDHGGSFSGFMPSFY